MQGVTTRLKDQFWEYYGLAHSLRRYSVNPFQIRRMAEFYAQFIGPGELCFDIGAHVGSRVHAWRRLGARVVAVEPQPSCVRVLRRWYGRDRAVRLVEQAAGAAPGEQVMHISRRSPGVTTMSPVWVSRVKHRRNFAAVRWDATCTVAVTTLDALIERFGEPVFCKIDVEGFEREVLQGLSRPIRALSFEYVPGAIDLTTPCLERLAEVGAYEFNVSSGESMQWEFGDWVDGRRLVSWLESLDTDELPGDVYARLNGAG
jgi:FkbM family methyltransferase